jgi:hypothetical protein
MWETRTVQVNVTSEILVFCECEYEDCCSMGCDTVRSGRKVPVFH